MKKTVSLLLTVIILSCCILSVSASDNVIVGDADEDGIVTILDATHIQRALADIVPMRDLKIERCDTDSDGAISILDATRIQRQIAGLPNDNGNMEEEWINKSTADKVDGMYFRDMVIREIHQYYFIAYPAIPMPYVIKLNGQLSDKWCVGDQVKCTYDNIWYQDVNGEMRLEADLLTIEVSDLVLDPYVAYKPVIYLYPEEETDVDVKLDLNGTLGCTAPLYRNGWQITASPDGTLTDTNGNEYPYLFWEGTLDTEYDLSQGFCVKGSDTGAFLDKVLAELGLNQREAEDFKEFWLPYMQDAPYNVITFQTAAYTDAAKLDITPAPDTTIRVFMVWYSSDTAVNLPAQSLTAPARNGFTAVEWGGSKIK